MDEFLKDFSKTHQSAVRNFTKQIGIYEQEHTECRSVEERITSFYKEEEEQKVIISFLKAVDEVMLWTRQVLLMELIEHPTQNEVKVVLRLPDMDREVSVRVGDYNLTDQYGMISYPEFTTTTELLETPIGSISNYLYEKIITIKDNPISLLYNHLYDMIQRIYHIINEQDGKITYLIDEELIKKHNIKDPLNVYRYMSIWKNLNEFFKG